MERRRIKAPPKSSRVPSWLGRVLLRGLSPHRADRYDSMERLLEELTPRERQVLGLMAEGRSNLGICRRLWLTKGTVEKHVHSILRKLNLADVDDDHRRVLAVLTYLRS